MNDTFILDACALIALLSNENGANLVKDLLQKASAHEAIIVMNKLNLLEVYYDVFRSYGKTSADELVMELKNNPIKVNHEIADNVFEEAGRLKASYKISLADSIALAETSVSGGMLVTSDHHEFDIIEQKEKIKFLWIR